jgi:hypothetical protein
VGEKINIHSVLVNTPEGKTSLERPRRGWGIIFQSTSRKGMEGCELDSSG